MTSHAVDRPTIEQLAKEVVRVGEKHPDYAYYAHQTLSDSCIYVDPDTLEGACIIGKALINLGVPPSAFLGLAEDGRCLNTASFRRLVGTKNKGVVQMPSPNETPLYRALAHVQSRQDAGAKWGTCIEGLRNLLDERDLAELKATLEEETNEN